jgi:hypothetical protein
MIASRARCIMDAPATGLSFEQLHLCRAAVCFSQQHQFNAARSFCKIMEHRRHASKNLGGLGAGPQARCNNESRNLKFLISLLTQNKTVASGLRPRTIFNSSNIYRSEPRSANVSSAFSNGLNDARLPWLYKIISIRQKICRIIGH